MSSKATVTKKKGIVLSKIGFEAADYLKSNIDDVTTYAWVVDKIDRGFGYDLTKFAKKYTCPGTCLSGNTFGTVKNFVIACVCSILDYFDLYKDLTLVLIVMHMTSKVLVRYFFTLLKCGKIPKELFCNLPNNHFEKFLILN